MEEFKIIFKKDSYVPESSFFNYTEPIITSATVRKSSIGIIEVFHIALTDIGLNSFYGEFEIIRENGFWKTSDQDSMEFNLLKRNIIEALMDR